MHGRTIIDYIDRVNFIHQSIIRETPWFNWNMEKLWENGPQNVYSTVIERFIIYVKAEKALRISEYAKLVASLSLIY